MKLYADGPVRRLRQQLGDVLLVAGIVVFVWLGRVVHGATLDLATP